MGCVGGSCGAGANEVFSDSVPDVCILFSSNLVFRIPNCLMLKRPVIGNLNVKLVSKVLTLIGDHILDLVEVNNDDISGDSSFEFLLNLFCLTIKRTLKPPAWKRLFRNSVMIFYWLEKKCLFPVHKICVTI